MTEDLQDGIYFNLPMAEYVALPRLGAHGLGYLLVSAATFWERSWLNPKPRAPSKATLETRMIGSAYHCARLELEHFDSRYVREPSKADFPPNVVMLHNGTEIGEELGSRGEPKKKAGESVYDQALRLEALGFDGVIWPLEEARFSETIGERIPLSPVTWDEIVTDGERLRSSPKVAALLEGGAAEVTILWTDERGVRCKCRPDKLTAGWWADLKSFSNSMGKNVNQAIADDFKFYRYHVAAAHYRDGIEEVRGGNLEIIGEASDEQRELIEEIQLRQEQLECWYVFQEKGGIPNILAKRVWFHEVPLSTRINDAGASAEGIERMHALTIQPQLWFTRARREISKAKRLFRTYSEVYQPGEPWLPFDPLGDLNDMNFNAFWLDEDVGE